MFGRTKYNTYICIMGKKISIDLETNGMISIGSTVGIGKTTLMCYSVAQAYVEGKSVLFITQDETANTILKKINRFLKITELGENKLLVRRTLDVKKTITSSLNEDNFDVIYVDCLLNNDDAEFLREIAVKHNLCVVTGIQQRRVFDDVLTFPMKTLHLSDKFYSLSVKKEFTWLQNLKYTLCFWLKKPNRTLKVLKNRYGSDGATQDFYLELKNTTNQ